MKLFLLLAVLAIVAAVSGAPINVEEDGNVGTVLNRRKRDSMDDDNKQGRDAASAERYLAAKSESEANADDMSD